MFKNIRISLSTEVMENILLSKYLRTKSSSSAKRLGAEIFNCTLVIASSRKIFLTLERQATENGHHLFFSLLTSGARASAQAKQTFAAADFWPKVIKSLVPLLNTICERYSL